MKVPKYLTSHTCSLSGVTKKIVEIQNEGDKGTKKMIDNLRFYFKPTKTYRTGVKVTIVSTYFF
jgi:hypothetical protein